MLDYIVENLDLFLTLLMIFIELITFLLVSFIKTKKKCPELVEVISSLPKVINHVESLGKTGSEKKEIVLYVAKKLFFKEAGYEPTSSIVKIIDKAIEDILSTPQKKGER